MEEETLLKVALVCSLTGVLILLFLSEIIEVKQYQIKDINKKLIEKTIKVSGKVERVTQTPGLLIFDINDNTGTITVVIFKEDPIDIQENIEVNIEGKVTQYKDKLEIIAEDVSLSN